MLKLEQRRNALTLRRAGRSYLEIGTALQCSAQKARALVAESIAEYSAVVADEAREHVALELARLDDMLISISVQVKSGNLKAIDRALKIGVRRAQLLGLNKQQAPMSPDNPAGELGRREEFSFDFGGRKKYIETGETKRNEPVTAH